MIDNLCFKAFLSLPSPGLANLGCQSDNNVPSLDSAQLVGKFSLNSAQLVGRFLKAELIRRINNGQVNFYIYSLKHQRSLLSMLLPSQSSEDRRGSSPVQFQVRKHLCTENSPSSEKVFQSSSRFEYTENLPGSDIDLAAKSVSILEKFPIRDGKAFIPALLLTLLQKVFQSPV